MREISVVLIMVTLSFVQIGCSNPYSKYYKGQPDARKLPGCIVSEKPDDLKLYSSNDFDRDVKALSRKGFYVIGSSGFNGPSNQNIEGPAKSHARDIGASIVLVSSNYTHTLNGAMPLTIPTTSTTYSTANATAYGPRGIVNAYGSGTSTTYGSQTTMMPYSVARSDFGAVFFCTGKPPRFGVHVGEIDGETKKKRNTNIGVIVSYVIENSPAYKADVFEGDILNKIGEDDIWSVSEYYKLLDKYSGNTVRVNISRGTEVIEKSIEIRSKN